MNSPSADQASPEKSKEPPAIVNGCWSGNAYSVDDDVEFYFDQSNSNLLGTTEFEFWFSSSNVPTVMGYMKGKVTSDKITFKGTEYGNKDCRLSGSGTYSDNFPPPLITGVYILKGKCPTGTRSGDFSINLGC